MSKIFECPFSPALSSKATREVSLARGLYFQEETYPINKHRPIVHTLGHNSLITIQKRVLPELQWYTLTTPDSSHCSGPLHKMVPNS